MFATLRQAGVAIAAVSILAVGVGASAALALSAMLVLGVAAERRREFALLRVLGWTSIEVRRQIAVAVENIRHKLGGTIMASSSGS